MSAAEAALPQLSPLRGFRCRLDPMPPWRLRRLRANGFTRRCPYSPEIDPLKQRLLAVAGYAAVMPRIEEDLAKIMSRGRFFRGYNSQTMRGRPCHCHGNTAALWEANPKDLQICTGYALSRDGVWRQHSWAYFALTDCVIETTVKRVLYYGYVLTAAEARMFAFEND